MMKSGWMKLKFSLLVSALAVVNALPQNSQNAPSVEIEKQNLTEVTPTQPPQPQQPSQATIIDDRTKDLLQKIAQVNRNQGLPTNGIRGNMMPYSVPKGYINPLQSSPRGYNEPEFVFPSNPYTNPIFEYLHRNHLNHEIANGNRVAQEEEGVPEGQVVMRKVTHHQQFYVSPIQTGYYLPFGVNAAVGGKGSLQEQTVDNVKNIIGSYGGYLQTNPYYAPYQEMRPPRQEFSWPWQQYFPIIIKDPMMQFMNALTTMVEYGPEASCKHGSRELNVEKEPKKTILNYNVNNNDKKQEISIFGIQNPNTPKDEDSSKQLEIEDLNITQKDPIQFTLNFQTPTFEFINRARNSKALKEETKRLTFRPSHSNISPPIRDQQLDPDEQETEPSDEVILDSTISKQDQINSNSRKKVFSKDNTGSGIFIHKIKVKAGGVAIAGPGGIATAGSGGTAIVGPNGYAYTHPDSLAIAGTGSKVIAVDPGVDLEELAAAQGNRTRKDGSTPRDGKVVAVGPVVYYNKGLTPSINGPNTVLLSTQILQPTYHSSLNPFLIFQNLQTQPSFFNNQPITLKTTPNANKPIVSSINEEIKVNNLINTSQTQSTSERLQDVENPIIPYKFHPLFNLLKTTGNMLRIRESGAKEKDSVTLILKPVARSIAGVDGKAIATPVSRAILKKGVNTDILFEPEAVAVAGPGGIAHAESILEIVYEDDF